MAERTLQVENRIRNGEAVIASGQTHRDLIAPLASARLEGLSASAASKLIDVLCGLLERAGEALGAAEDRQVAELADDVVPRAARDAHAAVLIARYTSARDRVGNTLGAEGLRRYGVESPATRTPRALVSQTENAVKLLRNDAVDLDDGIGPSVSTKKIAGSLTEAVTPLAEVLEALRIEERENEASMTARDRAIDEWTLVYQGVASMLSGLYGLAGRPDLAERIRPTVRRATGLDQPEPAPVPSGGGESGTDTGADPGGAG